MNFVDSYKYNIAAYELAALLGPGRHGPGLWCQCDRQYVHGSRLRFETGSKRPGRTSMEELAKPCMGRLREAIGVALLIAGLIGFFLPVVPGAPFLLEAIALLGPSHPRIEPWMNRIRQWRIW